MPLCFNWLRLILVSFDCPMFSPRIVLPGSGQAEMFGAQRWEPPSSQYFPSGSTLFGVLTVLRPGLDQGTPSVRHVSSKFSHKKLLLWHVHVRFDCAGLHKLCVPILVRGFFPVNSRIKCFFWHFHCEFSHTWALKEILLNSCPRGPCMIMHRSSTGDLLRSFLWAPGTRSLQTPCLRVLEVLVWKLLSEALGRFLYQDLVRSAPAAAGPFVTILWNSLTGPGMKILLQFLVRSSWKGPGEILPVSLHDMAHGLVWRSCWNPPQEVLALRSWRSSALVLVWTFFWVAHRKFLSEDLLSSSEWIYIEGPAAAVVIMSNLICYCSIATAACNWYIDFLPPTLYVETW